MRSNGLASHWTCTSCAGTLISPPGRAEFSSISSLWATTFSWVHRDSESGCAGMIEWNNILGRHGHHKCRRTKLWRCICNECRVDFGQIPVQGVPTPTRILGLLLAEPSFDYHKVVSIACLSGHIQHFSFRVHVEGTAARYQCH